MELDNEARLKKRTLLTDPDYFRKVPCVDGSVLSRFFDLFCTAGRSGHVCGLLMRHFSWPLAIMLSADPVPVKTARSLGAMAHMGCPDLWADWLGCIIRSISFPTSLSEEQCSACCGRCLNRTSAAVFGSSRCATSWPTQYGRFYWPKRWLQSWVIAAPSV